MINTREIAAEYRLKHWAQIMQEQKESGLSIKGYCETAGFHQNRYFYWQRKLREAACGQLALCQTTDSAIALPPTSFTRVKISKPAVQSESSAASIQGQVCVEVAGVHITADSAYPTEKLAALLRELTRS